MVIPSTSITNPRQRAVEDMMVIAQNLSASMWRRHFHDVGDGGEMLDAVEPSSLH
ncbi:hypothetical protein ACFVZH_31985 [Streptomyces sp. NPDC059534]|uniref:hypothetical protein n=1 Tax=Streptomyces sp. NPDC059534 TaxID=3346859 RepID=UPI00369149D2